MTSVIDVKNEKRKAHFQKTHPIKSHGHSPGFIKKRKWVADKSKVFEGSVREGQGFAFRRKQKVQYEYKKLLRKERKHESQREVQYSESYPDHLKHLYLAEEEALQKEAKERKKKLIPEQRLPEDEGSVVDPSTVNISASDSFSDRTPPEESKRNSLNPKKLKKKTSYQKTKEEYEMIQAKRAKKRAEAEKNKQQREEALRIYRQKKIETYQILRKKTKKGQPNLNLQMDYLLQKIQDNVKDSK
ncbi:thyroid transcription factor 1-associated protein 26 homolog [Lepisosteus oculatus]|uniref:Coiled-coil domain containing 59 n=1 Tax=Lepisosteus oculatus TaxID=7918 RepID=W5NHP4_LEPOC|nr:PREDICTED: thyroid transcription factor 1-associated protein 26 [Lepisosteus oculatus]